MALIDYIQTDTSATFNVGCSGIAAGSTTAGRQASPGGTPGSVAATVNTGLTVTRAVFIFDCTAPGASATWAAGNWTVPINFTAGDAGTTLNAVYVCDYNGSTFTTVASLTGLTDVTNGGTVTKTVVQGASHTPQSATLSRPFIVIVLTNADAHGGSAVDITPSATINSPIDDGAVGVVAVPSQLHGHFVNIFSM